MIRSDKEILEGINKEYDIKRKEKISIIRGAILYAILFIIVIGGLLLFLFTL